MRTDPRAGFTLVELLVAILILVVGVLGLASAMATAVARQTRAAATAEMTNLAESKLEEFRAAAVLKSADTSEVTMGGSLTTSETDHFDAAEGPLGRQYVRRWLIEAGPSDARKVTLRIGAVRQGGHTPQPMDFETLLLVIR